MKLDKEIKALIKNTDKKLNKLWGEVDTILDGTEIIKDGKNLDKVLDKIADCQGTLIEKLKKELQK